MNAAASMRNLEGEEKKALFAWVVAECFPDWKASLKKKKYRDKIIGIIIISVL